MIIEDEAAIREGIRTLLDNDEYIFDEAENGELGLTKVNEDIDLIILDIIMPGIDGFEVCKQIREKYTIPILMLSARGQDEDKLKGLKIGADDYLTKPFSYMELNARVKALLRRYYVYRGREENEDFPKDEYLEIDEFKISRIRNEVLLDGREVNLIEIEYQILLMLMEKTNRTQPIKVIYEGIWEEPFYYGANSIVMVHIKNLRYKIEKDPQKPKHIITVWGKGYQFCKQGVL